MAVKERWPEPSSSSLVLSPKTSACWEPGVTPGPPTEKQARLLSQGKPKKWETTGKEAPHGHICRDKAKGLGCNTWQGGDSGTGTLGTHSLSRAQTSKCHLCHLEAVTRAGNGCIPQAPWQLSLPIFCRDVKARCPAPTLRVQTQGKGHEHMGMLQGPKGFACRCLLVTCPRSPALSWLGRKTS